MVQQSGCQSKGIANFTLPDYEDIPAKVAQSILIGHVPLSVPIQLRLPELSVRLWDVGNLAALMLMPEAAIDEDGFLSAMEHDIGRSRKLADMQAVPIPHPIEQPPDDKLWASIL